MAQFQAGAFDNSCPNALSKALLLIYFRFSQNPQAIEQRAQPSVVTVALELLEDGTIRFESSEIDSLEELAEIVVLASIPGGHRQELSLLGPGILLHLEFRELEADREPEADGQ